MIDWNRVAELRQEVGEDDFAEVVVLFLEEVEETLARMVSAPDTNQLGEDMHFLKGCALNMGFTTFTDLCAQGEVDAAEGNLSAIDPQAVNACYETSKRQFLTELPHALAG